MISSLNREPREFEAAGHRGVHWVMAMNLALKDMSLQEKLAAMELLWEDLARSPESLESPRWHKEVLEERERVAEGKAQFADWETAKKDIRSKTS